jgi:hypothetical protein
VKIEDVNNAVNEMEKVIAGIDERLKTYGKATDAQHDLLGKTNRSLHEFHLECAKELIALKKDAEEFRRWSEKNGIAELKSQVEVLKEKVAKLEAALEKLGTRAWSVVPNLVGAIVNVILAAVVAFVVTKIGK